MYIQVDTPERLELFARDDEAARNTPFLSTLTPVILGTVVVALFYMAFVKLPTCVNLTTGRPLCVTHDFMERQEWTGWIGILRGLCIAGTLVAARWLILSMRDVVPSSVWWTFDRERNRLYIARKRMLERKQTDEYALSEIQSVSLVEHTAQHAPIYCIALTFGDLRAREVRTPEWRVKTTLESLVTKIESMRNVVRATHPPLFQA